MDTVESIQDEGGAFGKGRLVGYKKVDPKEWFFHDHFYQDPVMPGSLGLEAMIQLGKYFCSKKISENQSYTLAKDSRHEWIYRGQVRPHHDEVMIDLQVKDIDRELGTMTFDALLYL